MGIRLGYILNMQYLSLRAYLKKTGISGAEFGRKAGLSRLKISRLMRGTPGMLKNAEDLRKVYVASDGEVTPNGIYLNIEDK